MSTKFIRLWMVGLALFWTSTLFSCSGTPDISKLEATATNCKDLKDNDEDGLVDCFDPDCQGFTFCKAGGKDPENTPATCQDKKDNDNDGKTDCEDDDCKGFTFCAVAPKTETTSVLCRDKKDNDEDGKVDCEDDDCKGFVFCATEKKQETTPTQCQDGLDNDEDGKKDCEDSDCKDYTFCQENTANQCQDKKDNDGDGDIDCDDSDCKGFTFCATGEKDESTASRCQDKKDNDGDGKVDCEDPDCKGYTFCAKGGNTETTAALCQDKKDNDGDGKVDCDDPDCKGFIFCQGKVENTPTLCQDKKDNDGDGKVDCDDTDCKGFTFCDTSGSKKETTAVACQDKKDNDGDGKTDCDDPDCKGYTFCDTSGLKQETTAAACQDKKDNDGDGKTDCEDTDCKGFTFCVKAENNPSLCQDKKDNDGDGKTDCDDTDCQAFVFCQKVENTSALCQDKKDNDGDTKTDCDDPDCKVFSFCAKVENTPGLCQDKKDNDGDSKVDCDDSDCKGFTFCAKVENTPVLCQDKIDNDGDAKVDCDDPDCKGFTFCAKVENTATLCQDSKDNDGDGKVDCDDLDCKGYFFCRKVENTSVLCQDKKDNDGDGKVDCDDSDCAGFTFCSKVENTLAACQDKKDNDGDGKVDCNDPDCKAFLVCNPQSGGESSFNDCQDKRDNDGNGKIDCSDKSCWHWYFCAHYNGFPARDAWGATWDGVPRSAATWKQASDKCLKLGGRLPTATELYRSNSKNGLSPFSTPQATEYLWTFIPTYRSNYVVVVRLSDGITSNSIKTTPQRFRCFWPPETYKNSEGFDKYKCYGRPGKECVSVGRYQNIDTLDRPKLDYVSATNECAFYGSSVPNLRNWQTAIHNELPNGSNSPLWVGKAMYWYSGGHGKATVRWSGIGSLRWYYYQGSNQGSLSYTYTQNHFRCMGFKNTSNSVPPKTTRCKSGCMTVTKRRSNLLIDKDDRGPSTYRIAFATCRAMGADMPRMSELTEAIQQGLPNGTNKWLWTSESMYWYSGGYGHPLARWSGTGVEYWSYNGWGSSASLASYNSKYNYRCIWRTKKPPLPVCQKGQVIQWVNSKLTCVAGAKGTSNGKATAEVVDAFGNAWDVIERSSKTYAQATSECKSLGGRLPTASELYSGRAIGNPHKAIGQSTSTNFLWTITPEYRSNQMIIIRVSDGGVSNTSKTSTRSFRCIWPAKRSQVLYGNNCYGPPGNECFKGANGMLMDRYDRPPVNIMSANFDCRFHGGGLPNTREMTRMIHQSLPNGSNSWLWLNEPIYWYNGAYGYPLGRWKGTGTSSWDYTNSNSYGSLSYGYSRQRFRCVYTPFAD